MAEELQRSHHDLESRVTELHGGCLEMESEIGAGTTARVVFPKDRVCGG